jgi:hypothetical protein
MLNPPRSIVGKALEIAGNVANRQKARAMLLVFCGFNVGVSFYHHSFIHAVEVISTLKTTGTRAA